MRAVCGTHGKYAQVSAPCRIQSQKLGFSSDHNVSMASSQQRELYSSYATG